VKIKKVLKKLEKKGKNLAYYVDMGGEIYIYPRGDELHPIYKGFTIGFINEMMNHFKIRDDT
jgi:hypothetical protein